MTYHRNFDARRECILRKYTYLLPADIIGIRSNFSKTEIDHHVSDFNSILNAFEVRVSLHVDTFFSIVIPFCA